MTDDFDLYKTFDARHDPEADDEKWVSYTHIGSDYEEELNLRTGDWRHRPRPMTRGGADDSFGAIPVEEWRPGRAPKE